MIQVIFAQHSNQYYFEKAWIETFQTMEEAESYIYKVEFFFNVCHTFQITIIKEDGEVVYRPITKSRFSIVEQLKTYENYLNTNKDNPYKILRLDRLLKEYKESSKNFDKLIKSLPKWDHVDRICQLEKLVKMNFDIKYSIYGEPYFIRDRWVKYLFNAINDDNFDVAIVCDDIKAKDLFLKWLFPFMIVSEEGDFFCNKTEITQKNTLDPRHNCLQFEIISINDAYKNIDINQLYAQIFELINEEKEKYKKIMK